MARTRRPVRPNYTARRILFGIIAVAVLALLVGAVVWLIAGPVSSLLHPAVSAGSPKTGAVRLPETAATTDPVVAAEDAGSDASAGASATETSSVPQPRSVAPLVTIASVGDMMFGRGVSDYINTNGGKAVFSKVEGVLTDADLTLGNLEGSLATKGDRIQGKDQTLLGNPKAISGLTSAGFDAVGLANNHTLDFGETAMDDTIRLLDAAGIAHSGAGKDWAEARKPADLEAKGAKVAFLAFSEIMPDGFAATTAHGGIARASQRMDQVQTSIRDARKTHDYVVVMFHWGVEYKPDANGMQRADAHAAVDAGADLVLGAHPHVIQGLEAYKGRLIAYSLGDFVFDHYTRATGESFILRTELGPDGVGNVRITPTYLGMTSGKPSIVTGSAAATILKRLKKTSADLHTKVTIEGDTATVEMP
jgi:poly-gamma-glutamate capsule biosynthesis protein CapA/YwtB (metallophosphatase superfamily)